MANLETWLAEENSIIQKPDNEKQAYLYEWLERLHEQLNRGTISTEELKRIQSKIVAVLHKLLEINCSPATRQQLSKCFASIYQVGTTLGLFDSVNKCLDFIKSKDDGISLHVKLSVICCLGSIYEKLGRLVATLFDASHQILTKMFYKTEPEAKCEILLCYQKMLFGLGNSASSGYRDIYKACKACLIDKSMAVRCAASKCTLELSKHATFLCTTDLDAMVSVCLKALEGSNYDVRVQVAQLLGVLMAGSQTAQPSGSKAKKISIEEMFSIMAAAFLKGGTGFMKASVSEAGMNREIRLGVTQAYVVFFREMGTKWVSRYLAGIIIHILELVASQKATSTHIDAVHSRKCVSFILNSTLCGMLSERSQVQAVKELCKIISKQMHSIHDVVTSDNHSDVAVNVDVISTQHVLVCALEELSNLVLGLTSSVKSILNNTIIDAVFATLIHPAPAVWLSAAWCIRSCAVALPHNVTYLIKTCMGKMSSLRSSKEAVTGYGYTIAAIIGGLYQCPLGIPFSRAKQVFALTTELLHTAGKSGKLAVPKIQTGWILLGSLCALGPEFIETSLPKILTLWTSSFPSKKDMDAEKGKGNLKSWQLTLENRAGALCSMASFVAWCDSLLVPDIMPKLVVVLEAALSIIPHLPNMVKLHGAPLQPFVAMYKVRLYQLLRLVQPKYFEFSFTPLLRVLVAEFTLADKKGSITTSMLQSLCHQDDSILLGSWLQETDHKEVEEQLQLNSASGSGALEHDSSCIYARCTEGQTIPGPLPLGVAVIDAAIDLFGHIFPVVTNKHRQQLMAHFNECIIKNKGARQQAIQTNIFTAFLAALKNLADSKCSFGEENVRKNANALIEEALSNSDPILRCAAGEALGRMAQVVNEPEFVARMAQRSFEKCQKTPDAMVRTGHALALGCLHRYVGGMESGQHLRNSVSILIALAKDQSSSLVQVWSLHGLTLIADSGGPMFRQFVNQSLGVVIDLLLRTPPSMTEVHQCLGKFFGALITAIGPEYQENSKVMERSKLFSTTACSIMENHPDSLVQSEAVRCMQQLHVFAPNVVNLHSLVPRLCNNLLSAHLVLRKASVECLRQLAHKEAKEICDIGKTIVENNEQVSKKMYINNKGLEGLLFSLLDAEGDSRLLQHIRETIISLLTALVAKNLKHWFGLCKQVLLASNVEEETQQEKQNEQDKDEDEEEGKIVVSNKAEQKPLITPKWPNRVFAMESIRLMLQVCKTFKEHVDLSHARKFKENSNDFLVTQLSELVRMAFIAGTSTNDLLKLEGMKALQFSFGIDTRIPRGFFSIFLGVSEHFFFLQEHQDVVVLFANVPDPDFSGHLILEQFQAQVGTALRPAFADDVPPDVTAMACEVCSSWIGFGISRDINDVRRIQQLLIHSLEKIGKREDSSNNIYSESAYTLETLGVLKAWAQIYIMAMKDDKTVTPSEEEASTGRLLDLVEKDLPVLNKHWINAIRDYVLLTLPSQYASQLPPEGGNFYSGETMKAVRPHYKQSWPPIVHAISLWLTSTAFVNEEAAIVGASDELPSKITMDNMEKTPSDMNRDRFQLILGVCVEALCSPLSVYPPRTIETCVESVQVLLETQFGRKCIVKTKNVSIELMTVLHRVLLSLDDIQTQENIIDIVHRCVQAYLEKIDAEQEEQEEELREVEFVSKKSLVFSGLEICLYIVGKYTNDILPEKARQNIVARKRDFDSSYMKLLSSVSPILSNIIDICAPEKSAGCLPTIIFLLNGVFKYITINIKPEFQEKDLLKSCLSQVTRSYKKIISCSYVTMDVCKKEWNTLLDSSLFSALQIPKFWSKYSQEDTSSAVLICWENLLMIIYLFVSRGGNESIITSGLLKDCVKYFSEVILDAPAKLQLPAIKILETIIKSSDDDIAVPFIRSCIPKVVGVLERAHTKGPCSDMQLSVCKECILMVEIILAKVEEINREKMMSLYIPSLVHLLHDSNSLRKANSFERSLHEFCIQKLTATGPLYPNAFRAIMAKHPALKEKLTAGIKANDSMKTTRNTARTSNTPVQPQIKLKMDFSNFK